jgi:hypothetical protein
MLAREMGKEEREAGKRSEDGRKDWRSKGAREGEREGRR